MAQSSAARKTDATATAQPRQADLVLTIIAALLRWHATRSDDDSPPIVAGMRRRSPAAQSRSRTLTDEEIRVICQV
ncbi:MAG: hypothetical protein WBE48_01925, partial [Xanthobacteraceae bacterium]